LVTTVPVAAVKALLEETATAPQVKTEKDPMISSLVVAAHGVATDLTIWKTS
jgi:hypothetical protein